MTGWRPVGSHFRGGGTDRSGSKHRAKEQASQVGGQKDPFLPPPLSPLLLNNERDSRGGVVGGVFGLDPRLTE